MYQLICFSIQFKISSFLPRKRKQFKKGHFSIGLVRNFLRFFRKFPVTAENVLEYSILEVYQYCSNDKKIIEMER